MYNFNIALFRSSVTKAPCLSYKREGKKGISIVLKQILSRSWDIVRCGRRKNNVIVYKKPPYTRREGKKERSEGNGWMELTIPRWVLKQCSIQSSQKNKSERGIQAHGMSIKISKQRYIMRIVRFTILTKKTRKQKIRRVRLRHPYTRGEQKNKEVKNS